MSEPALQTKINASKIGFVEVDRMTLSEQRSVTQQHLEPLETKTSASPIGFPALVRLEIVER